MNIARSLAISALAIAGALPAAAATTYPTFALDTGASSITVNQSGCSVLSCATLTAGFAPGATGFSWTPTSASDSIYVSDFFNWSVSGIGIEKVSVAVTLAFSSPESASGGTTGSGLYATFAGIVSAGVLKWNDVTTVGFGDGSTLTADYDKVVAFGFGNSKTSGATFSGNFVALPDDPSPVPLPASVPLLGAGLAALGLFGRRKRAA